MKKILLLLTMLSPLIALCQNSISEAMVINQIERMMENDEEDVDYIELLDAYWDLCERKVNVNDREELSQLIEFHLISIYLIESICDYRKRYGDFLYVDELKYVDGMDEMTVTILKPLVCFERKKVVKTPQLANVFKYAKHKILLEVDCPLNKKAGYKDVSDSILYENPNKKYLGSPLRLFARYNFTYGNKVEAGFVLEKDAGEYLFSPKINDSLKSMLAGHLYKTVDFASLHLLVRDIVNTKIFNISTIAIGDYQVGFGQGLTMGSGVAFTSTGGSLLRKAKNIRASKSANETKYLRGAATTMRLWKFDLTAFYSNTKADANVSIADSLDKPEQISALQQTGLHRTFGELIDRHAINKELFGGNISFMTNNFHIGYTIHKTRLSCDLIPDPRLYNTFYFKGNSLVNQGIDFYYIMKKFSFYGEVAVSDNMAPAAIIGTTVQPQGYIDFTILYRYYDKSYQNFYSNAFSTGSGTRNERGLYLSTSMTVAPRWKIVATADFPQSDWIKTQAYSPSRTQNFHLQINHQINDKALFYIQLNYKDKEKNGSSENTYMRKLVHERKVMLRFHIAYPVGDDFTLKNRVEYHNNGIKGSETVHSYLIYQDVVYNPDKKPFSFSFRYALFNSPDGSIYAYENDVLYSFSVGSLRNKGMRIYLVGKVKIANMLSINAKIGCTIYSDIDEIGSDLEKIEGNVKADAKIQMLLKI